LLYGLGHGVWLNVPYSQISLRTNEDEFACWYSLFDDHAAGGIHDVIT